MNHTDLVEILVVAVILLSRLWSRFEHRRTEEKITEVHVLVNGKSERLANELEGALRRIRHLESELKRHEERDAD